MIQEDYVVECNDRKETNEVMRSIDEYKEHDINHWCYFKYVNLSKNATHHIYNNLSLLAKKQQ